MSRAKRMLERLGIEPPKPDAPKSQRPTVKHAVPVAGSSSSLSSFTVSEKRVLNPEFSGSQRRVTKADTSTNASGSIVDPIQTNPSSGGVPPVSIESVDKVKQWLFRPASPAVPKSDVQPEIFSEEVGVQGVHIEIVDVLATPELDLHNQSVDVYNLITPDHGPIVHDITHLYPNVEQVQESVTPEAADNTFHDENGGGARKELFPTLDQDQLNSLDPEDTILLPLEPMELEVEVNVAPNKRRRTNLEPAGTPTKKRKVRKETWQDSKRKLAHNLGQEFVNKKGQTIKARTIKTACTGTCRRKCTSITENTRRELFTKYWNIQEKVLKWLFISKLMNKVPIKSRTVSLQDPDEDNFHRKYSYEYYLPDKNGIPVQVCQKMFLNTFDISVTVTKSAQIKNSPDKRGASNSNHKKRLPEELVQSVKDHIKSFPVVESHYCRKDSKRKYLDDHLNVAKMHRLYMMGRGENEPNTATLRQYRDIFNGSFNLSFHKPKKDLCSFCVEYDGLSEEQKNHPDKKKAYDTHISDKELVRQLKIDDKAASREEGSHVKVVTFDLQKVFFCPRSDVGECFYKRKLSCYDFTIFDCTKKIAHCYVWDQTIGGRKSGEFASALLNFMEYEVINNGVKEFDFYSDSCSSQNKNQFLFAMYYIASMKFDIKIRHRYLIKGHTQMECDSVHGRIEKKTFRQQIYTPAQWYGHIRTAKVKAPQYKVKEVKREEIFTFKPVAGEHFKWNKLGVSKFREVVVDSKKPGKATIREDLTSEPKEVQVLINKRGRPINWKTFQPPLAHDTRIPLKPKLVKDLQWYVTNNYIPAAHHAFYKNITEPVPGVEVEDDDDDVPQEINTGAVYEEREDDEDEPEEQDDDVDSNFNEEDSDHDSDY